MPLFNENSVYMHWFGALAVTLGLVQCNRPAMDLQIPIEATAITPEVAADGSRIGETVLASLPWARQNMEWATSVLWSMSPPPADACASIFSKGEGSAAFGLDDPALLSMIEQVAGVWEGSGTMPDGAAKWYEYYGNVTKAKGWMKDYCQCIGQDSDHSKCLTDKVIWPGLCFFAAGKLSSMLAPEWAALGLPFEAICNGEPAFKCCKYTWDGAEPPLETQCHSAFNTDGPVNCEAPPPGGKTYGICIPNPSYPGDPGCFCDYLPLCGYPVVERQDAEAWRFNQLMANLAHAVPPVIYGDPAEFFKFVMLRGGRSSFRAAKEFGPFADGDPDGGYMAGDNYHANDTDAQARRYRAFTTLAVSRIVNGIPNIRGRWNIIGSKLWTAAERTAYLASIPNPDTVLRDLVGPIGVKLLKQAEPKLYKLLAVQVPNESPWPEGRLGGVLTGKAPTLTLEWIKHDKKSVRIRPKIIDPQYTDNQADGVKGYLAFVDWGDGTKQALPVPVPVPAHKRETSFIHTYFLPGQYHVRAWVKNTAGLYGYGQLAVVIP